MVMVHMSASSGSLSQPASTSVYFLLTNRRKDENEESHKTQSWFHLNIHRFIS